MLEVRAVTSSYVIVQKNKGKVFIFPDTLEVNSVGGKRVFMISRL